MSGMDISTITVDSGTGKAVFVEGQRSPVDHIPFIDRQATQTLLPLNYIVQSANGYFPLSTRLTHGTRFNLPETHRKNSTKVLQEECFLVVRLHLSDVEQLLGLKALGESMGVDYVGSLFEALESTDLHRAMNKDLHNYWYNTQHPDFENSIHGKHTIDLVLPYSYKAGRSSVFRAMVPKHWAMILFGRLSDEVEYLPTQDGLDRLDRHLEALELPESLLKDPSGYCGFFRPCKKREVCKKIHPDELEQGSDQMFEVHYDAKYKTVNTALQNKIQCYQCGVFFSSRRGLFGHLTQVHGMTDATWKQEHPLEPFISVRKLVQPPTPRPGFDARLLGPEDCEGEIRSIECMVQLTNHRASETSGTYLTKPKINLPKWLQSSLKPFATTGSVQRPVHLFRVKFLWHSPTLHRERTPHRQATVLPTKWSATAPHHPQTQPIEAIGTWDGKSNHLFFDPHDNDSFFGWPQQGIGPDMIVLASFEIK